MKTITALTVGLLSLTACTTKEVVKYVPATEAPVETTEAPTTVAQSIATYTPPTQTPDEQFLDYVHMMDPVTESMPDSVILDAGHGTCQAIDGGATPLEIANMMLESSGGDTRLAQMFTYVGAGATTFLCPWNSGFWME